VRTKALFAVLFAALLTGCSPQDGSDSGGGRNTNDGGSPSTNTTSEVNRPRPETVTVTNVAKTNQSAPGP
jgi:hypothetical protein